MEGLLSIMALALATGAVALVMFPRKPRPEPRPKTREDIRAEWARERRHWAGAPDLREGGE